VACASPPPEPRSADLIMPAWVSGNEPTASKSKQTKRLEQKPGLLYGDPGKGRAPSRQRAAKSPFLPKASNSPFFGGCGAKPGEKCP
jgi:hypothetical protein